MSLARLAHPRPDKGEGSFEARCLLPRLESMCYVSYLSRLVFMTCPDSLRRSELLGRPATHGQDTPHAKDIHIALDLLRLRTVANRCSGDVSTLTSDVSAVTPKWPLHMGEGWQLRAFAYPPTRRTAPGLKMTAAALRVAQAGKGNQARRENRVDIHAHY